MKSYQDMTPLERANADPRSGPRYPKLEGIEKHRWKARAAGSVAAMAPGDRRAYGLAVLDALRRANRPKAPPHSCPCASKTWLSDGGAILAAVRQQQMTKLDAPRAAGLWLERNVARYHEAMHEKREREHYSKHRARFERKAK